jgi:pimeloyl-ACP methyl ester carboxylesterase
LLYNRGARLHAPGALSRYFRQDYVTTPDGARLYFQVHGEGEPAVVMCDGIGCDGFAWKYLLPQLTSAHRVIRWHYRGHGCSGIPQDPRRIGFQYIADDLARVLDAAEVDQALIFGHSMGVQVSLEFHRRHADRCLGLVLLCGSYGFPLDTVHDDTLLRRVFPFVRILVELLPRPVTFLNRLAMKAELTLQLALSLELNRELMQRNDLVPYFDHLAKMSPAVFIRTLESLAEHTAWDHLPRIDVPTLIIGGERDRFTPVWLSRRMAEAIPDAEFMIVPRGSHTAPLEQPQLVGQRIDRFLRTRVLHEPSPAAADPAETKKPATPRRRRTGSAG